MGFFRWSSVYANPARVESGLVRDYRSGKLEQLAKNLNSLWSAKLRVK